ncbi:hypothetical protein GR140_32135 (plasmid) [Pseudomonas putida]|uniref:hypothetical protein n=1 Tax=Pseudomonas putida TaxID=303 RepID=UPI001BAFA06C|nr:hypothetical protein [Pseudomonas putida]QUG93389.1 hypothetical protein GR140_32135 [Pseudomonas putida]
MNSTPKERKHSSELFPLLTRFAQEIRLPLTVVSAQVVEAAKCQMRLLEVSTLTVSPTGATSWANFYSDATMLSDQEVACTEKPRAQRLNESQNVVSFAVVYEHLTKIFLASQVIGFGSSRHDVPLLLNIMTAGRTPPVRPKAHLDIQRVCWHLQQAEAGDLAAAGAVYNVSVPHCPRGDDIVLATARIQEAMLWRHGYQVLVLNLEVTDYPYAPQAEPVVHASEVPARSVKAGGQRGSDSELRDRLLSHLSTLTLGPNNTPTIMCLAKVLGTTETKISIVLGQLIDQRRVDYTPFVDSSAQEMLEAFLPAAITLLGNDKLKPLREHVQEHSGRLVDYIQLRIALLKRKH